jgi:hypothetical protein
MIGDIDKTTKDGIIVVTDVLQGRPVITFTMKRFHR